MKKFIIILLTILITSTVSTTVRAAEVDVKSETKNRTKVESAKPDASKYAIKNPDKHSFSVDKKISFLNGIAPQGTAVNIKHFGTADLKNEKYNLLNLPKEDEYIEISSSDIVIGKLGIFDRQLDLVSGINKIVVDFNVEGIEKVEIFIYVNVKNIQEIDKSLVKQGIGDLIQKNEK